MKKYDQIDISGDAGLKVRGRKFEELLINAAEGMSDLITDTSVIKETETKKIVLSSDDREDLMVQWLNELVFLFDTYGFIGTKFSINVGRKLKPAVMEIEKADAIKLTANITGGIFDPGKNERGLLIKAATYHNLSVKKIGSSWEAIIIFDI
jgi:SHS2 domain-containing protein